MCTEYNMDMNWSPMTDFETEFISMQPDHDFIFGALINTEPEVFHPRPESHLLFLREKKRKEKVHNGKLSIISKVQRMAGTKPLGEQTTIEDWDDNGVAVERETIAMMRHLGLNPSLDEPLNAKCTIATRPITQDMHVMQNGHKRMPILYDEKFFKLKPRIVDVSSADSQNLMQSLELSNSSNSSLESADISESSFNNCVYELESLVGETQKQSNDSSNYNTANESLDDASYSTAYSNEYIPTNSWYRSEHRRANNSICSSQSSSSGSASGRRPQVSKISSTERFYTAKQLYDKNRKN